MFVITVIVITGIVRLNWRSSSTTSVASRTTQGRFWRPRSRDRGDKTTISKVFHRDKVCWFQYLTCHSINSPNSKGNVPKDKAFPAKKGSNKDINAWILCLLVWNDIAEGGRDRAGWKYSGFLRCTMRKRGDNWCNQSGMHFCILIELLSWLVLAPQSTIRLLRGQNKPVSGAFFTLSVKYF